MQLDEKAIKWGVENEPIEEVKHQLEEWKKIREKRKEELDDAEMNVKLWETISQRKGNGAENKD